MMATNTTEAPDSTPEEQFSTRFAESVERHQAAPSPATEEPKPVASHPNPGTSSGFYFDAQLKLWRSANMMSWTMSIFAVFTFIMGFLGLFRGDFVYSGMLFLCSGVTFLGLIVAVIAGYRTYAKWYFVTTLLTLFFFLILHGGVNQTGLYWCMTITPGILYMVGPRIGLGLFAVLLVILITIFYADLYPWPEKMYRPSDELRFSLALTATALFALGYDYLMVKSGLGNPDWQPPHS